MLSYPETTKLSFDEQKKNARGYGIAAAICTSITAFWFIPFSSLKLIAVLAMLGLVGTGWKFIFHGSTAFSMTLQGANRKWFQIFISIITPILFSIYFLKDAQSITLEGINVFIFQDWTWLLFSIGLIGYSSWHASEYLDRDHPFRGFLITSTIFFVLCFCGQHGIHFGNDDDAYGYNDVNGIEVLNAEFEEAQTDAGKEKKRQRYPKLRFGSQDEYDRHKEAVEGGLYLFLYIRCVAISYTAMFLGLCWNRRTNKTSTREQEKIKEFINQIWASIKIVSDYGAVLEKKSEEELVFVPESRLPHSKEKIINAIRCVELFIEKALSDESLKKNFFLHPAAVFFDKTGAEYIFSEKYRKSLKVGLIYLVTFVSDELAEKLRKSTIVMDYMDKKGIKSTDNLTAEEWEEFRRVVGEAFKL